MISRLVGVNAQVLLGQLPPQLPELPLPEQARIIGSVTSPNDQAGSYRIFLDVPRSPQQVRAFYREQLHNAGWTENTDFFSGGFVATETPGLPYGLPSIFCKDAQYVFLSVVALPNAEATAVSVQLQSSENPRESPCNRREELISRRESIPLPELIAPPNTQVATTGGGSSNNRSSTARIESSLTNQALIAHYVSQLQQAGWRQQTIDTTDSIAWSFLTRQDDQGRTWQGFLSIAPAGALNTYAASIVVLTNSELDSEGVGFFSR
ncbi:MAG: hypothetical protein F6K28_27040 [Microcoleus sp. SIO2G3]|nr:hypothetical protein [Microcoleus sp. SIO2G3]